MPSVKPSGQSFAQWNMLMQWKGVRLGLGLLLAVVIAFSLTRRTVDGTSTLSPPEVVCPKNDPPPMADLVLSNASQQDESDLQLFLAELDQELARKSVDLSHAINLAVDEATDMTSCGRLVGYLAYDLMTGDSTAHAYLHNETRVALDPAIERLTTVGRSASERFLCRLDATSSHVAYEFCARAEPNSCDTIANEPSTTPRIDYQTALQPFGIGAACLTPAAILDAAVIRALLRRHLTASALQTGAKTAARVLAVPVARTGASAVGAAADGPLPIGDVIAVACTIWTIYDIASLRVELRDQLRIDIARSAEQARHQIHQRALSDARETLVAHARAREGLARQFGFTYNLRP